MLKSDIQHQNSARRKTSFIDCDYVQPQQSQTSHFLNIHLLDMFELCCLNHLKIDKNLVVIYTLQLQYKIQEAI